MQGVRHFSSVPNFVTCGTPQLAAFVLQSVCSALVSVCGQVSFLWSALCWDLRRTCHLMQNIVKFVFVQLARYLHNLIIYLLCCLREREREREKGRVCSIYIIKTWQQNLAGGHWNRRKRSKLQQFGMICEILIFICLHILSVCGC